MAIVDVDDRSQYRQGGLTAQVDWLGLRVGGHLALSRHSSNKPVNYRNLAIGDRIGHDDNTINTDISITTTTTTTHGFCSTNLYVW